MPVTREDLRERLDAAWNLKRDVSGGARESYLAATEALPPDAEALGDPEILFEARILYVDALRFKRWDKRYREVGAEALGVLRSCLRMWSADPHRYDQVDVDNMWTLFHGCLEKFIREYPEPADRMLRLVEELERHCPPDRTPVRSMLDRARLDVAQRRGDVAEIERLWLALRAQGPPKKHVRPDIAALHDAAMWTRLGRHDRAIAALAPVLAGQIPKNDSVRYENGLLMAYLHTGRVAEAVAAHQRTYARSGMSYNELAAHLEFCARTGNEERGLDVLHRNLGLLSDTCRSIDEMWAMAAVALLCRRAVGKGLDREWFEPCECEEGDAEPGEECDWPPLGTYVDMFRHMRWGAIEFAQHMEKMDGTPHLLEGIRALLRAEPVVERLELPPDAERPAHLAPPRPSVHLAVTDAGGLRRELDRVRSMEPGDDRIVRTEHVLQNAVAGGETEVAAEARFMLLDGFLRDDDWDTDLLFTLQALFRLGGERPDLLGPDRLDAIWRAVPTALDRVLTVPGPLLRQIRGFLDVAEPHHRPGTEDLHDVRWYRTETAARSGDADAALAAWARFRELPPADRYTTRAAVLRSVGWWLDLGLDEQAFAAMQPLLAGGEDEREDYLLLPYLRVGRTEKARAVHERTYRTADDPTAVAAHLRYCARTGALDHGRDIIKRVSGLFHIDGDDDFPFDRLRLHAAAIRLSERLVDAGLDETWARSFGDDRPPEHDWTFARLAASCRDDLRAYAWRWEEVAETSLHTRAVQAIADGRQEES